MIKDKLFVNTNVQCVCGGQGTFEDGAEALLALCPAAWHSENVDSAQ